MAVMEALLRLRADVTGEGEVTALGRAIGGIKGQAAAASAGLQGMTKAAGLGGLAGAMGSLAPLLSVAGLIGMSKSALDAGASFYDMSQKTGASVESLAKLKKAAGVSGTSIDAVASSMTKLAKGISSSLDQTVNDAGESAAEIKDRMKRELDQAVNVVKDSADRQVDAIKDGERRQLDTVKENADKRLAAIERESDSRLDELGRRYRQEEKLLNDKYDDEADRQDQAAEKRQKAEERAIERRYSAQIEAIQESKNLNKSTQSEMLQTLRDAQSDELEAVRDRYQQEAKVRDRALRDQEDAARDAINRRRKAEEAALKSGFDKQRDLVQKSADEQTQAISRAASANVEAVQKGADASIAALRDQAAAASDLSGDMEELGLNGKGASAAFKELSIELRNADGTVKSTDRIMMEVANRFKDMPDGVQKTALAMKLFGKSGAELIPMLNMGGEAIDKMKVKMDTAFAKKANEYRHNLTALGGKVNALGMDIAKTLLPVLEQLTDGLTVAVDAFNKVDPTMRSLIVSAALLAIAWGPITGIVGGLIGAFQGLAFVGPLIAGWLGYTVPMVAGMQVALTGLLTWIGGTLIPALLAFFSGPAGWTVLAVAAVVAMVIAFRKPIGDFLSWFGQIWEKSLKIIGGFLYDVFVAKWIKLYDATLREPVEKMFKWLSESWIEAGAFLKKTMLKVADAIKAPFVAISNVIRDALRSTLQWVANGANTAINLLNDLIEKFNKVPGIKLQPIANVSIPEFADGGVVNRPTLAMVGEGGEREYIIPESKMARAAAAYMGGARGDAVLAGPATINVTTGPVMQQQGQQWVTMADLQRAMRTTESATLARLRTPAGRAAAGVRNG